MVREEVRIFTDPGFWASSFLRKEIRRQNTFCTHALHAKTLQFKYFFPRHSTQTLTQLKYPYPNSNEFEIEISLPKP